MSTQDHSRSAGLQCGLRGETQRSGVCVINAPRESAWKEAAPSCLGRAAALANASAVSVQPGHRRPVNHATHSHN